MWEQKKNKADLGKYLISGIGPGVGGVGRLMKKMEADAHRFGLDSIYRKEPKSIKLLLKQRFYIKLIGEILDRIFSKYLFSIKLNKIRNSKVLFIHPQTAGWDNLFKLIDQGNKVYLYLMDNSFFCIESYNFNKIEQKECLKCIDCALNVDALCMPFPVINKKSSEIENIEKLKEYASKIYFLAQNRKQADLVNRRFGTVNLEIVGLDTGEVSDRCMPRLDKKYENSIVLHAATNLAKGVGYFVELAEKIAEANFIIPDSQENVEKLLNRKINFKNLIFYKCTWNDELGVMVRSARLVINPSLWSAPIEGALIKSLAFNNNVATVKSKFGFESELSEFMPILRLDPDIDKAALQIKKFLRENSIRAKYEITHVATNNVNVIKFFLDN